ncbi:ketopantoate reductase family protein [Dankookia sp. GCM10030260]|uniref:ketopantoate reductase family protein n=1 Tax=Dankookia sp. GCM10030260 TaxID=3273390 RepID=UPI00360F7157
MRVTVLGAGAVGGWLAAGLARAGVPVAVLARGATLAALRADGLTLQQGGMRETFPVTASDDPAELPPADILLLGLKSHDLPAALPLVERLLGPGTLVATAQNGLPWWFLQGFGGPAEGLVLDSVDPGGALARAIPVGRVLGGVAHVGSRVDAPGVIRLMKQDRMLYGDPSGRHHVALAALVGALDRGGIPAQAVADIRMEVWLKLWGNSNMNPLSALSRADMLAMLDDPGVAGLIEGMMREMAAIGDRIGLPIAQSIPERLVTTRRLGAFRTSMLQDLEAGRPLETGPVLGCLVELAQRLAVPAPMLAGIHGLVRLLERSR